MGNTSGSIMAMIRAPLGIIVLFIVMLTLAGLSIAAAISGELTAAAVSSAGLLTLVVLLVVVGTLGKT